MKIENIFIQNFRKLKRCEIDLDEKNTICVGANNSGKTAFMDAIVAFLTETDSNKFTTRDFTLNVWDEINAIGEKWLANDIPEEDLSIEKWDGLLPSLDIWIKANSSEAYLVKDIIPSLDWNGDPVGARVRLEPDIPKLYKDYKEAKQKIRTLRETESGREHQDDDLYPKDLWNFLDRNNKIQKYFKLQYYILDSSKLEDGVPQPTPEKQQGNILKGLVKIDYIEAQRGFSDPNSSQPTGFDTLSRQLSKYYDTNGDPIENLTQEELPLLEDINKLTQSLNEQLDQQFKGPVGELEKINYPGFQNPAIKMNTRINPKETLNHESSVLFNVDAKGKSYDLAEKYNGLGYRNLISMYFQLIHFRESWVKKRDDENDKIEPIHLVLIEEPEAHLHAQAQQVFVKKAYEALINNEDAKMLHTQLIVSTHSTYIAHEFDFNCLRYFRRFKCESDGLPITKVVNLTNVFGEDGESQRFVKRYIKLTHCDIFFADAVIFVEGAGERILMPQFLNKEGMSNLYISIIEIGGAHAHRFRPLIEKLGVITLVITDLDSQEENGKRCKPERGKGYTTNNDTLRKWLPGAECSSIDALLDLPDTDKINGNVRVAYQHEVIIQYNGKKVSVIPYTLEDAVGLANVELFKNEEGRGLIKKFHDAVEKDSANECQTAMYDALQSSLKAPFAIDLLFSKNFESLKTPQYIKEGLAWLKTQVSTTKENAN